jgi:hypothetical protein
MKMNMRKITNLFLALGVIALMGVTTSCEDNAATNPPTIEFLNGVNETTLDAGVTSYTIAGNISSDAGLSEVKFFQVTNAGETQMGNAISSFNDKNNYDFQFQVTNITEDVTIKVQATDKDNLTASKNFMIHFTAAGGAEIDEFTAILLGGQSTTEPSLLDANTGTRYHVANNEGKNNAAAIDIVYYYGSANNATLAAPDDATVNGTGTNSFNWTGSWATQNATRFGDSSIDFNVVSDDSEIALIANLSASKMTGLAVDDILAFETAGGKKGLIKVTALTVGESGSITLDVKIQK